MQREADFSDQKSKQKGLLMFQIRITLSHFPDCDAQRQTLLLSRCVYKIIIKLSFYAKKLQDNNTRFYARSTERRESGDTIAALWVTVGFYSKHKFSFMEHKNERQFNWIIYKSRNCVTVICAPVWLISIVIWSTSRHFDSVGAIHNRLANNFKYFGKIYLLSTNVGVSQRFMELHERHQTQVVCVLSSSHMHTS